MKRFFRFSFHHFLLSLFCFGIALMPANAQSTALTVYNIIQDKCADAFLADDASGNLDLSGEPTSVYGALVGAIPDNEVAAAKNYRWIDPGNPYNSFLLKKLNNGLIDDKDAHFSEGEGTALSLSTPLTDIELETIRQWIYFGAPPTGNVVDIDLLSDFYMDGGSTNIVRPDAPAEGQGFQIHLGPLFIPSGEKEYLLKMPLYNADPMEVKRLDVTMNEFSHHFILYKFETPANANSTSDGLRDVNFGNAFANQLVSVWQFDEDFRLPGGTAYMWEENTVLELNYHIPNYSGLGVLQSEVYINVYTQPAGTAIREMKSNLLVNPSIDLPANETTTLTSGWTNFDNWNIWMMTSHTHQYGSDFDVYLRNPDGTKGEQIYEGFFDYEGCQCDIGYYDWEHQPVRYFEPYFELPPLNGIIQEAEYVNTSNNDVFLGLTSLDEMMITIVQYTEGEPIPFVAISNLANNYCENSAAVELELLPAGGVLTGDGVQGNLFDPSQLEVGLHTLTYTFEEIAIDYEIEITPALETPTIFLNEISNFLIAPEGFDHYQWYANGEPVADATGLVLVPIGSGDYYLQATLNDCEVNSNTIDVFAVGVEDIAALASGLQVAPNPYQDRTMIQYALSQTAAVQLNIYNMVGQKVLNLVNDTQQNSGTYQYEFGTSQYELPKGVYFAELTIDGKQQVQKFVEQ
ncbi:MAG: T9SS type A sorting domain-containing protein [Chitinophagales bacterium]